MEATNNLPNHNAKPDFSDFIDQKLDAIYAAVQRFGKFSDRQDAEDVTIAVFVDLYLQWPSLDKYPSGKFLINIIVLNIILYNKQAGRAEHADQLAKLFSKILYKDVHLHVK